MPEVSDRRTRPVASSHVKTDPLVLFIHQGGGVSGSGTSLYDLVVALSRWGFRCRVLLGQRGALEELLARAGIPVMVRPLACFIYGPHVPLHWGMILRFLLSLPGNLWLLPRLLRQISPDVVYLNTSVLLGPALTARIAGFPIVWHARESCGYPSRLCSLLRLVMVRLSRLVIANSHYIAQEFGGQQTSVHTVYNAVDLARYNPDGVTRGRVRGELGLSTEQPVVGIMSVIARPKGHFVLLEAASKVVAQFPEVRFLVVGGSTLPAGYHNTWRGRLRRLLGQNYDDEALFRQAVKDAGLGSHFIFAGFRTDVPQILADLDLLVFPSIAPEGFGRPLIEAGAMAVPVIATDIGPSSEIIPDGETGLLVPPGSADALATAIIWAFEHPQEARAMGEAGRQRVIANFALDVHAAIIADLLQEVLAFARVQLPNTSMREGLT